MRKGGRGDGRGRGREVREMGGEGARREIGGERGRRAMGGQQGDGVPECCQKGDQTLAICSGTHVLG